MLRDLTNNPKALYGVTGGCSRKQEESNDKRPIQTKTNNRRSGMLEAAITGMEVMG